MLCTRGFRVLDYVDPFLSDTNLLGGARWTAEIEAELNNAELGISCVTHDSHDAPWLNFEAGYLFGNWLAR